MEKSTRDRIEVSAGVFELNNIEWKIMTKAIFGETDKLLKTIAEISSVEVTKDQFELLKVYFEVFLNSRGMNISITNNDVENNETKVNYQLP